MHRLQKFKALFAVGVKKASKANAYNGWIKRARVHEAEKHGHSTFPVAPKIVDLLPKVLVMGPKSPSQMLYFQ